MLSPLRLFGIKVIPSIHCVLWPKFRKANSRPNLTGRLIRALNRKFFLGSKSGILTMSSDIAAQVSELTEGQAQGLFGFLPTYRAAAFDDLQPCDQAKRPFRVFFAGRIETNKGVYDLLSIAQRFADEGRTDVEFDLCGSGAELERLKLKATAAGLASRFRCHGHCERWVMRDMLSRSHVVVVPTRTDFVEGFNQVVAEAVLAHPRRCASLRRRHPRIMRLSGVARRQTRGLR
jgi:glycosyltransferase involved in cell wall biosynthesis